MRQVYLTLIFFFSFLFHISHAENGKESPVMSPYIQWPEIHNTTVEGKENRCILSMALSHRYQIDAQKNIKTETRETWMEAQVCESVYPETGRMGVIDSFENDILSISLRNHHGMKTNESRVFVKANDVALKNLLPHYLIIQDNLKFFNISYLGWHWDHNGNNPNDPKNHANKTDIGCSYRSQQIDEKMNQELTAKAQPPREHRFHRILQKYYRDEIKKDQVLVDTKLECYFPCDSLLPQPEPQDDQIELRKG